MHLFHPHIHIDFKSSITLGFFLALISLPTSAQRIVGGLESNLDMQMTPDDDADRDDEEDNKEKKIVPVDISAWTIDEKYGNLTPAVVDTLQHLYPTRTLNEGAYGHYNHLGNLGTPRLNRIYMERSTGDDFIFINPYDQFFITTPKFLFFNTKSPFLNADYSWCGDKQTGDSHIKVTFTNNAGKRVNFGAIFDYMYAEGYYANQSAAHMGSSAFASYIGDRYDFHFYYTHNHMKTAENGGITDEEYITKPENQKKSFDSNDIPTLLSRTWSRQDHDIIHFNHRYNIGFWQTDSDSVGVHDTFVPVTSIFHTLHLQSMKRTYIAYNDPQNYHTYTYLPGDSANDRTNYLQIKNLIGLSLREGFNKYAVAGINAYIGFDRKTFKMLDGTPLPQSPTDPSSGSTVPFNNRLLMKESTESDVLIGGQIIRTQGTMVHYNVSAELVTAGDNQGDFNVNGHGELNLPVFGDTAQVSIDALIENKRPSYYIRHYHSKHAWWDDEDLDQQMRTRIMGTISIPHTRTTITVGVENIKNYTYFADCGKALADGAQSQWPITNNFTYAISPMQYGSNIQVISANLRQDFKFGPVHFDNDVTYQYTSHDAPLPLPTLSLYSNLYLQFKIAKVLKCELGGDVKFFTKYNAPAYSPVLGQFMTQNAANTKEIGNYPILSAYANFDLKRTRFYVQYYHANQSEGHYFWAPGYPVNPSCIRFGLSWNFYD